VRERLELENASLQSEVARRDSELQSLRRRAGELQQQRGEREAESRQHATRSEAQRRGQVEETVDLERRHQAEVQRLKAGLVDLERRLESVARAESQARRKLQEAAQRGGGAAPEELQRLQARLQELEGEVEELRGENDFLNGEVARYHQKNTDLQAQVEALKES
jgi:predicted nuclease with TOPRIM domain